MQAKKNVEQIARPAKVGFSQKKIEKNIPATRNMYLTISFLLFLGFAVSGAYFYYQTKTVAVEEEVQIQEIVTETKEVELKREDLKIQVLNGTGTAGIAGKMKDYLEDLGYIGVETGNAETFDYAGVNILLLDQKNDYKNMILEDLEKGYEVVGEVEALTESDFDVVVIVGN